MKPTLTIKILQEEAYKFTEPTYDEPSLYKKDNGKSIGTHIEKKFKEYLAGIYEYEKGMADSSCYVVSCCVS